MNALATKPEMIMKIVGEVRGTTEMIRSDGLHIFIDGDTELDELRMKAPKEVVIAAVGIRRGQEIMRNYAEKHARELRDKFQIKSLKEMFPQYFMLEGVKG